MDISKLIKQLQVAKGANRRLDADLAPLAGWRSQIEEDNSTNPPVQRRVFLAPNSGAVGRVPSYTASLEDAKNFTEAVHGSPIAAVRWDGDGAFIAQVNDGPKCKGANPAIALCLAALRAKWSPEL